MKRFRVNVSVENIAESIRFYSTLFEAEPVVQKDDYAKWMLDDPRINFAISARGSHAGSDKYWVTDPTRIAWETFHTLNAIPIYGMDADVPAKSAASCCT